MPLLSTAPARLTTARCCLQIPVALALCVAFLPAVLRAENEAEFKKSYALSSITTDKIQAGDILIRRKYDSESGLVWKAFNDVSINLATDRMKRYKLHPDSSVHASHAMLAIGDGKVAHADTDGIVTESIPAGYHLLVFRPTNEAIRKKAVELAKELADKGLAYSLRKARKMPVSWNGPNSTPGSLKRTRDRVQRYLSEIKNLNGKKVSNPKTSISLFIGGNTNLISGKGFFCTEFVAACYQAANTMTDGYIPLRSRHTTPIDLESFLWNTGHSDNGRFKFVGARVVQAEQSDPKVELAENLDVLEGTESELGQLNKEFLKVVKQEGAGKVVEGDVALEEKPKDDVAVGE